MYVPASNSCKIQACIVLSSTKSGAVASQCSFLFVFDDFLLFLIPSIKRHKGLLTYKSELLALKIYQRFASCSLSISSPVQFFFPPRDAKTEKQMEERQKIFLLWLLSLAWKKAPFCLLCTTTLMLFIGCQQQDNEYKGLSPFSCGMALERGITRLKWERTERRKNKEFQRMR